MNAVSYSCIECAATCIRLCAEFLANYEHTGVSTPTEKLRNIGGLLRNQLMLIGCVKLSFNNDKSGHVSTVLHIVASSGSLVAK